MLVIEGNVFYRGKLNKLCLGIEDGKIKTIKKMIKGDEHIVFNDKIILPAGIDIHVHFRDPGFEYKEDFGTGTASAAFGGIGCTVDMPNTKPPTISVSDLKDKIVTAQKKAYIDFGLNAALTPETKATEIAKLVTGFKLYLSASTSAHYIANDDEVVLKKLIADVTEQNKLVSGHCEDEKLFKSGDPKNLEQYLATRPSTSESNAVKRFISCSRSDSMLHICHVSAKESVGIIKTEKKRFHLTCEVAPHHLFLNAKSDLGGLGKVNPPLRSESDQVILWNALNEGIIDVVASDHAPHTIEEKRDFEDAPSGIPGVETMYPLMLLQARKGRITLNRLVNAISEKPAELLKFNKGLIEPEKDADLIVVDMKKITKIRSDNMHTKCGWTPYENHEAIFPILLMVKGYIIVQDGELIGKKGYGRYVS